MKDEQIIALYFARNEDAIGETDKKYGARLLQLAQRILLDQFACEEVRSDTYLKTWNAIPPQRPPVFPAFLSRLTRQVRRCQVFSGRTVRRNFHAVP